MQANLANLSFSGQENAPEVLTGGTVTIRNCGILENAGRAAVSRTAVDSIYFEAGFDWDPGLSIFLEATREQVLKNTIIHISISFCFDFSLRKVV